MEQREMKKIVVVTTGGTFSKRYDRIKGVLAVESGEAVLESIASKWLTAFQVISLIGKDSLEMTGHDRLELLLMLSRMEEKHIVIIHGTDTMHLTAASLADAELEKRIVLTGAMVPYEIDPVEATANFASAVGYLQAESPNGVYIAMNGFIAPYDRLCKEREKGCFLPREKAL